MADTAPVSTTLDFTISAKRILRSVKSIDLSKAQVSSSAVAAPHPDASDASRVLVVKTMQDEAHPIHVLECRMLKNGCLKINSYQYSKCVEPRSTKPRALRFLMPTGQCKGARKDLRDAMERLAKDKRLQRRLDVKNVEVVKETPRDMEWRILLS
ncbi:hypothetical protein E4U55_002948 [Claviceps digitariae]|nr:hypothetical protein E4U55_002948 [Claviceps digitariae]